MTRTAYDLREKRIICRPFGIDKRKSDLKCISEIHHIVKTAEFDMGVEESYEYGKCNKDNQAIAELQKRKTEIQNRLQNGQSQDSTTIGGNSFTEDEWKKIIQKMDEYLTEVKQEQKERFEKRDKEKEIQQFYEKMKMAEQYKKPQAEKLTIQKHLDGEDIAPYSYLAEDGVITYNGVSFFCDYENNAITLGDMSDEKNVITVQLENGGCLKVNRDNIEDLSKAIAMFSPEDIRRILVALQQDAKVRQMQQEIEQDKIKQLLAER